MRRFGLVSLLIVVMMVTGVTHAQETPADCPSFVEETLQTVSDLCSGTGRNQACFGNQSLQAEPQPNVAPFVFAAPGDRVDVASVRSLTLAGLDTEVPEWGIALMQVQANLPDTLPGQNVTVLLFGDVALEAASQLVEVAVTVMGNTPVNLRRAPAANAEIITTLAAQTPLTANGRSADGSWIRLTTPEGQTGWSLASLFVMEGSITSLSEVAADDPVYRPMQAFYLRTGVGELPCAQAPQDGVLIQTPEGAARVELWLNEVHVTLGSTAYIQAHPGAEMTINLLEGQAEVTAFDTTRVVPAGMQVRVPLDENGHASAAPREPEAYDTASWGRLPLELLPRLIEIVAPLFGACAVTANDTVNLRSGPGTVYDLSGSLPAGLTAIAVGQTLGSDGATWLQLINGMWVRADIVQAAGCSGVPTVTDIPPAPTAAPPSGGGGGQSVVLWIVYPSFCSPTVIPHGSDITVGYGMGYDTEAEAQAGMTVDAWGLTANGQPVPVSNRYIENTAPNGAPYSVQNVFHWGTPDAGTYNLIATDRAAVQTCTVTITP